MSIEDVQRRQAAMLKKAESLQHETDPERILAVAKELREEAAELQEMATNVARAFGGGELGGPEVRVVLTPDQRERIVEETGVPIDSLVLRDPTGAFERGMPERRKHEIERLAIQQAAAHKVKEAKEKAAKDLLKRLEEMPDSEHVRALIAKVREDPTLAFLSEEEQKALGS